MAWDLGSDIDQNSDHDSSSDSKSDPASDSGDDELLLCNSDDKDEDDMADSLDSEFSFKF
jgi:hypothetical protein